MVLLTLVVVNTVVVEACNLQYQALQVQVLDHLSVYPTCLGQLLPLQLLMAVRIWQKVSLATQRPLPVGLHPTPTPSLYHQVAVDILAVVAALALVLAPVLAAPVHVRVVVVK